MNILDVTAERRPSIRDETGKTGKVLWLVVKPEPPAPVKYLEGAYPMTAAELAAGLRILADELEKLT